MGIINLLNVQDFLHQLQFVVTAKPEFFTLWAAGGGRNKELRSEETKAPVANIDI